MEIVLSSQSIYYQARGSNQHCGKQDAKTHLCFADAVVPFREVCSQAIGGAGERNSKCIADDVAERYET